MYKEKDEWEIKRFRVPAFAPFDRLRAMAGQAEKNRGNSNMAQVSRCVLSALFVDSEVNQAFCTTRAVIWLNSVNNERSSFLNPCGLSREST